MPKGIACKIVEHVKRTNSKFCITCNAKRERSRWIKNKQFVRRYKVLKGCMDCDYKGHFAALQLDHRPGTDKKERISAFLSRGRELLKTEMRKCDVVCSNCHAIRTFDRL